MGPALRILPLIIAGLAGFFVLTLIDVSDVQAQTQIKGLKEITDAADQLCGTVPLSGQSKGEIIKGKVNAELPGLLKKLVDLGFALDIEITSKDYQGVLQEQLADTLGEIRVCKQNVLKQLMRLIDPTPPPPPTSPRVEGWLATFTTKEQGGGAFRAFPACTVLVSTPAAIDIRGFFPADLSPRNVVVSMSATTEHDVRQPGRWVYYVRHGGSLCTHFEFTSDGAPVQGNPAVRQGGYVNADASFPVYQRGGQHRMTLNLTCYFLGGQFPVAAFQIQPPSGMWRPPAEGDFTVKEPINTDRPPGAPGPCPWNR